MKVGVTGTRYGMTVPQMEAAMRLLQELHPAEVHHGDCVGADETFADLAGTMESVRIVCHPPSNDADRAWTNANDQILPALNYLERNRNIVEATEVLIAAPREVTEQPRGGTWYTVRYARKCGRSVYIIWPKGMVAKE